MRSHWLLLLPLALAAPVAIATGATEPLRLSRQCLVVVTQDWNSPAGVLRAFERKNATSSWEAVGPEVAVVVGKKGLGWGRGLMKGGSAPVKVEGDHKAPAGIFRLPQAFGYAPPPSSQRVKLPYLQLTKDIEGIDDPRSRYYNQLVDRSRVARVDWRTSEKMRLSGGLYKWGVVVDHNVPARPGAGSCIFLHIWKDSGTPTTGCTAMAEKDLVKLLRWLDPAARPVLVQMPRREYAAFQAKLGLPAY